MVMKAYAKLHGSYKNLEKVRIDHILSDLTGCPCDKLFLKKYTEEELFSMVKKYIYTDSFLVSVTGCNSEFFEDGFCYNILGVIEKEGSYFVRLRENR
mmetsp:Transcript_58944/g.127951  ORF Transcript_58944/g.127951 Transcript_58944/m.127951 type:complete len:98 (-) Transcript_58944:414-707(-)